jgi:hypothetical protein
MLASVALISILSTSIVSRMTAERVVGALQIAGEPILQARAWARSLTRLARVPR